MQETPGVENFGGAQSLRDLIETGFRVSPCRLEPVTGVYRDRFEVTLESDRESRGRGDDGAH